MLPRCWGGATVIRSVCAQTVSRGAASTLAS
jgi:hypothetical protein